MGEELKPCPFCGSDELLGFEPSYEGGWTLVKCRKCGCSGPSKLSESEVEAAAHWNTRAAPPQPDHSAQPVAFMLDGAVGGSELALQITDLLELQNRHGGILRPLYAQPLDTMQGDAQAVWTDERKLALKTALQLVAAEERLATAEQLLRSIYESGSYKGEMAAKVRDCLSASTKPEEGES